MNVYLKNDKVRSTMVIPFVVTEGEKTWQMSAKEVVRLDDCNHIEADTRVVLYASQSSKPVVTCGTDTDILILLTYAYWKIKPNEEWFMKIDRDRFVQVKLIVSHYGELCNILPAFHSITGCNTTSYPYNVGKVKPFQKMVKGNTSSQLSAMGRTETSYQQLEDSLNFVQRVMYPGKEGEGFVETRMHMYKRQKIKSSLTLLPDLSSTKEHLKRADLQAYIWYQCLSQRTEDGKSQMME